METLLHSAAYISAAAATAFAVLTPPIPSGFLITTIQGLQVRIHIGSALNCCGRYFFEGTRAVDLRLDYIWLRGGTAVEMGEKPSTGAWKVFKKNCSPFHAEFTPFGQNSHLLFTLFAMIWIISFFFENLPCVHGRFSPLSTAIPPSTK
jgi:hypothetical protein